MELNRSATTQSIASLSQHSDAQSNHSASQAGALPIQSPASVTELSRSPSVLSDVSISSGEAPTRLDNADSAEPMTAPSIQPKLQALKAQATQTYGQNQHYQSDMSKLAKAIQSFNGICPKGGYPKGTLQKQFDLIGLMEHRYSTQNNKSDWINRRVGELKGVIEKSSDPETVIKEKRGPLARFSTPSDSRRLKNAGFDTESTAKEVGQLRTAGNATYSELTETLLPKLVTHFRENDSLFKRLPLIESDLKLGNYELAAQQLEDSLPAFMNTKQTYEENKSSKCLAAIKQYINCAMAIPANVGNISETLDQALTALAQSDSRTLDKIVMNLKA